MDLSRLATLLLGAWLAGSGAMFVVATQNFRSVERLLDAPSPSATEVIQEITPAKARAFLRYQVGEQNRWYFYHWEFAQLALGVALLAAIWLSPDRKPLAAGLAIAMMVLVGVLHFYLTPQITSLGRALDFVPADHVSAVRSTFWRYHGAYSGLELAKMAAGLCLGWKLLGSE